MLFELVMLVRMLISADVEEVVHAGTEGYFGVWPGYAPVPDDVSAAAKVRHKTGRDEKCLAVSGGFAEVTGERVIILAESAEPPEEDPRCGARRAREAAGRATVEREEPLGTPEDIDYTRESRRRNRRRRA